jgi:hypothetical protein
LCPGFTGMRRLALHPAILRRIRAACTIAVWPRMGAHSKGSKGAERGTRGGPLGQWARASRAYG